MVMFQVVIIVKRIKYNLKNILLEEKTWKEIRTRDAHGYTLDDFDIGIHPDEKAKVTKIEFDPEIHIGGYPQGDHKYLDPNDENSIVQLSDEELRAQEAKTSEIENHLDNIFGDGWAEWRGDHEVEYIHRPLEFPLHHIPKEFAHGIKFTDLTDLTDDELEKIGSNWHMTMEDLHKLAGGTES